MSENPDLDPLNEAVRLLKQWRTAYLSLSLGNAGPAHAIALRETNPTNDLLHVLDAHFGPPQIERVRPHE